MSSAEPHLGLRDIIVRSAEKLCEGKLCCLRHGRNASALCLLCKIYHSVDHLLNKYLKNFVAAELLVILELRPL